MRAVAPHRGCFAALRSALRLRHTPVIIGAWAVLHLADRVIAGMVQCQALGCLPQ
jgi:hypothetical protein